MSSIIQQGSFTSTGIAKTIKLRSDVDWIETRNFTQSTAGTINTATHCYWQCGMAAGSGLVYYHPAGDQTLAVDESVAGTGFTLIDSSEESVGAAIATTAITAANPPLVLTGTTSSLIANSSIVRLYDVTGGQQYGGIDWSIGAIDAGVSFALAHSPQPIAATNGTYRKIASSNMFYPKYRYVTAVTKAASAVVTMSVTHDYVVGQLVRFTVPSAEWGMIELNGLAGTIIAIDNVGTTGHNTITVDIDTTGFTTFALPLTAVAPFSPVMVVPVGVSATETYGALTTTSMYNRGYIGVVLGAGALAPAGANADVIYWRAGKSFNL